MSSLSVLPQLVQSTTSTSASESLIPLNTIKSYAQKNQTPLVLQNNFLAGLGLEHKPLTTMIIATNLAVFLAWQSPKFSYFMNEHFTTSVPTIFRQARLHTLVTSAFSHATPLHFLFNNIALFSVLPVFEKLWGIKETAAVYVGSAIVSNIIYLSTHYMIDRAAARSGRWNLAMSNALNARSLGASGVLCAFFVCFANMYPNAQFSLIFLPQMHFDALTMMSAFALFDTAGFLATLVRGYGFMGLCHSAHLAGYLTGLFIYKIIDPQLRKRRAHRLGLRRY